MTSEFRRLGKRGSYRLGQLRAQGVGETQRPAPFQPQFNRPDHRWPAPVWLLAVLAGILLIAGAAKLGWWFGPFIVGALAGVVNWIGGWRARLAVPTVMIMAAAGWGVPLVWAVLDGQPVSAMARVIAMLLGLPASAVNGIAVTLLVAVAQGVLGYWLGRALTPHRTRRNPRDHAAEPQANPVRRALVGQS
jgi:hypothetical protein